MASTQHRIPDGHVEFARRYFPDRSHLSDKKFIEWYLNNADIFSSALNGHSIDKNQSDQPISKSLAEEKVKPKAVSIDSIDLNDPDNFFDD
jgi:hypothetical protein